MNIIGEKRDYPEMISSADLGINHASPVLLEPPLLLSKLNTPDVRMVKNQIPWMTEESFFTIDIAIQSRGVDEDSAYANSLFFRNNIRRGNTLVVREKEKDKAEEVWLARRGLKKFFDLRQEYIDLNLKKISSFKETQMKEVAINVALHQVIFEELEEMARASTETEFSVYQTNKANGENAQISYFERLGAWVVCSKNVSILIRDARDLEVYERIPSESEGAPSRYNFAILIGRQWIKTIKEIRQKGEGLLDELKVLLKDHTLVGEYCGDQNFQHLVKYDEICILFYSLIPKEGSLNCLPPEQTFDLLKKFGLKPVSFGCFGPFKSFSSLNENLETLFKSMAESNSERVVSFFNSPTDRLKDLHVLFWVSRFIHCSGSLSDSDLFLFDFAVVRVSIVLIWL